ncbi:MAG: phosphatase PAP2 family protein, partial [Marmoricola sp.]
MTEAELRPTRLRWSALCFVLFAILALLVRASWDPLLTLDADVGRWPEEFTSTHHAAYDFWRLLGLVTSTLGMTIATIVAALALAPKHRRAALWTIGVMATTGLLTWGLKLLVARDRPEWDKPLQVLTSYSFPSGHSSGIAAAAGVTIVLTRMLVRKQGVRRLVVGLALAIALLVGADRIFLGVHNLSDVVAGYLLGAGIVLAWLAFYDPTPRSIALVNTPLADAVPTERKKLAVILNPSKIDDAPAFRTLVEALALDSGYASVVWWETTVEDTGYGMAHEAAVSGSALVLAIGG